MRLPGLLGDPVVQFAGRQSLRWTHLAALAGAFLVLLLTGGQPSPELLRILAMFPFLYAIPHAASRIIDLDRGGRLDHLRLSGRQPARLFAALLVGGAGPWMMIGTPLMVLSIASARPDAAVVGALLIVWGASVALSVLALAMPRREDVADSRILTIGLVTGALFTAAIQQAISGVAGSGRVFATILVIEVAVTAIAARAVVASIARPQQGRLSRRRSPASMSAWLPTSLRRGWMLTAHAGLAIGAIVFAIVVLIPPFIRAVAGTAPAETSASGAAVFSFFLPLVVGAIVVSSVSRADRESGRYDLVRLQPASPAVTLAGLVVGAWLPFVLASAAAGLLVAAIWRTAPVGWSVAGPLVTIIAALPLIEGWHRRWPMTYTLPVGVVFLALILPAAVSATQTRADAIVRVACLSWVVWAAAWRTFRRPDQPPLTGWAGVATLACLCVVTLWPSGAAAEMLLVAPALLAAGVLLTIAFTVDQNAVGMVDRAGPGISATVVSGVMMLIQDGNMVDAGLVGVATGASWWAGRRIQQASASRPAVGAAVRVFLALLSLTIVDQVLTAPRTVDTLQVIRTDANAALAAASLGVAVLAEAAYRFSRAFLRRALVTRR